MTSFLKEKSDLLERGLGTLDSLKDTVSVHVDDAVSNQVDQKKIEEIQNLAESINQQIYEGQQELIASQESQDELKKELADLNETIKGEFNKHPNEFDLNIIKANINEFLEKNHNNKHKRKAVERMNNFLREIDNVSTFKPLIEGCTKIKNKRKFDDMGEEELKSNIKKSVGKFKKNIVYSFIDPTEFEIVDKTEELLNDRKDAVLFLTVFFGFAGKQNIINKNPIFVNEVLRQLKYSSLLDTDKVEEFRGKINNVLTIIKEG